MMMHIDHDSITPLYVQLTEQLQAKIQAGIYKVGMRLPSERELASEFNVSRMTARQALQLLMQNGLAQSQVGKGTYVCQPKIDQELSELTSFSEDMRSRGRRPSSRVVFAGVQPAGDLIAQRLGIPRHAEVVALQRVRLADQDAIALETSYLIHSRCPGILEQHDFSTESLYEVLRISYGIRMVWAEQGIESRLPDKAEREALGMGLHEPVLSLTRVTFNEGNQPVEFVTSVYRGSSYQFRAILRRSESPREARK